MIISIIIFVIAISIIVIIHELGHFLSAIKLGVKVEEFGLGIPPKLFSITKRGIIWSLNLLPLGGFVRIKGEEGENPEDYNSFASRPVSHRLIILSSGVFMNFLLAIFLFFLGFSIGWPVDLSKEKVNEKYLIKKNVMVAYIKEGFPAEKAGLNVGDFILEINNKKITDISDIKINDNKVVKLKILRNKKIKEINISPKSTKQGYKIGIGATEIGVVRYPFYLALWESIKYIFYFIFLIFKVLFYLIYDILFYRKIPGQLGGPVAIAAITKQAVDMGMLYVIQLFALVSLNLAIVNFLPFPALDGGRVIFLLIEKFKGKKVEKKVENLIHTIGFWILIIFILIITLKDVSRFGILDKIKEILK